MENLKKLCFNLLYSTGGSAAVTAIVSFTNGWNWTVFSVLTTCFFILGTFYGADEYNITGNWPKLAKKVKSVIGNILATILFAGAVLSFIILIIMLGEG